MAKNIFKIEGVKRDYANIPELMKAGYRQVKLKKRRLYAFVVYPGIHKGVYTEEVIGYFTADPYSDLILFMGQEWYGSADIKHAAVNYRIYSDGSFRLRK